MIIEASLMGAASGVKWKGKDSECTRDYQHL